MATNPSDPPPRPLLTNTNRHDTGDDTRLVIALAAAREGNQNAFSTIYHDLHPRLLKQLRPLVGETDAHDVASEAWLHILGGIGTFHGGYSHFQAWAAVIARRRAIDHLRRKPAPTPIDPIAVPEHHAPDDTEHDAIARIATAAMFSLLRTLPPEQQKAILLRVIIGFDNINTAKVLGKRPGSIRTNIHRALRTLASRLAVPPA